MYPGYQGPPGWPGQPMGWGAPPPKKSNAALWIVLGLVVVVALVVVGGGLWWFTKGTDDESTSSASSTVSSTDSQTTGLGALPTNEQSPTNAAGNNDSPTAAAPPSTPAADIGIGTCVKESQHQEVVVPCGSPEVTGVLAQALPAGSTCTANAGYMTANNQVYCVRMNLSPGSCYHIHDKNNPATDTGTYYVPSCSGAGVYRVVSVLEGTTSGSQCPPGTPASYWWGPPYVLFCVQPQ